MLLEFLTDFAFSTIFATLRTVVKNADSKETMKRVFLKLYRQIAAAYAGDPDFAQA